MIENYNTKNGNESKSRLIKNQKSANQKQGSLSDLMMCLTTPVGDDGVHGDGEVDWRWWGGCVRL